MIKLPLKLNVYSLLCLLTTLSLGIQATNGKDRSRRRLQILLQDRPELADKFLKEAAKKDGDKPTPTRPLPPPKPPVVVPEPASEPTPEPEPIPKPGGYAVPKPKPTPVPEVKPEPPKPVVKPWMTENDLSDLNTIFTVMETNSMTVYACLDAFFCKANCQPYRTHVDCLKKQLAYLRTNLLRKFPQAETPERRKIFTEFQKVATTLERAELALLKVIDQKYSPRFGALKLGTNYLNIKSLLETLKKEANQSINAIKRELRPDKVDRLNKLRNAVNRMFDFGKNMGTEIIGIIKHRLKT